MVASISHLRKKIMKRKARMTMTLSVANARIDHFLNEEGGPSISPVTGSALDRRTKKNLCAFINLQAGYCSTGIYGVLTNLYPPFGTRISNRAPVPGVPVSWIVMPVMDRISRARNRPIPLFFS